jgi:hypothetical protein
MIGLHSNTFLDGEYYKDESVFFFEAKIEYALMKIINGTKQKVWEH